MLRTEGAVILGVEKRVEANIFKNVWSIQEAGIRTKSTIHNEGGCVGVEVLG
jgi:hypothetical protein